MSVEKVREYLKEFHKDQDIQVLSESSATVELAAKRGWSPPDRQDPFLLRKEEDLRAGSHSRRSEGGQQQRSISSA
ncbi:MAG: hypothetical protein ACLUOI_21575 [Eisenbergiella sp.]